MIVGTVASAFHDMHRGHMKFEVGAKEKAWRLLKPQLISYCNKIQWMKNDFLSNSNWPYDLRKQIKADFDSDPLTSEAIMEKIDLLLPQYREQVEDLIDALIEVQKKAGVEYKKIQLENQRNR